MIPEWLIPVGIAMLGGGGLGSLILALSQRRKNRGDEVTARTNAATDLSKYVDDQIAAAMKDRDETITKLTTRVEGLERNQHELHDAIRTRETQLWLWDLRGRVGVMPMLPSPLLQKLGLAHLIPHEAGNTTEENR